MFSLAAYTVWPVRLLYVIVVASAVDWAVVYRMCKFNCMHIYRVDYLYRCILQLVRSHPPHPPQRWSRH